MRDTPGQRGAGVSGAGDARAGGLDVARVVEIGAVVLSHAMVAYLQDPIPGLLWPVQQSWETGGVLDGAYVALRCVGVPLVTFVGGVLAARALERRGSAGFVRERFVRLGVPLVLGVALVLPLMYVIWVWGWVERGWAAWEHLPHVRFGPAVQPHLHGLGHFWYLQYALLLALLTAGWWWVRGGLGLQWLGRALATPLARVMVLAVAGAGVLWLAPGVILDFVNGFVPQAGKLAWLAVWYVAGLGAWTAFAGVMTPKRGWVVLLEALVWGAGAVLVVKHAPGLRAALAGEGGAPMEQRVLLAVGGGMLAAGSVVVLLEASTRVVALLGERGRGLARRGAALTYWVFMTHLVWQGLAVVALSHVDHATLPAPAKIAMVFGAGIAGCVLTAGLAERTSVGRWMLGKGMSKGARARGGGSDGPV